MTPGIPGSLVAAEAPTQTLPQALRTGEGFLFFGAWSDAYPARLRAVRPRTVV